LFYYRLFRGLSADFFVIDALDRIQVLAFDTDQFSRTFAPRRVQIADIVEMRIARLQDVAAGRLAGAGIVFGGRSIE